MKDDWERQLPLAVFAINIAASTLCCGLTPFFMDSARPRLPRSEPHSGGSGSDSEAAHHPSHEALRLRGLGLTAREL